MEEPPPWLSPDRTAWAAAVTPWLRDWLRRIRCAQAGGPSGDVALAGAEDIPLPMVPMVDVPPVVSKLPLTPEARLAVGRGDDLLAIGSTHANSGQTYTTLPLVLVRSDRLELVDTIGTFEERLCAYERTQRLDLQESAQQPFADILATVTEVTAPSGEDCGEADIPEAGTRAITVTYRWDAAKQHYSPSSDAFEELARENEGRF